LSKQPEVSFHFASDFFSMQPALHPIHSTKIMIQTDWHSQKARPTHTSDGPVSPSDHNATTEGEDHNATTHPNATFEAEIEQPDASAFNTVDEFYEVENDNFHEQARATSPTQFMAYDTAHSDAADERTMLLAASCSGDAESIPAVTFSNRFGEDVQYTEQYGTASMLPPIDNSSKRTSPQRLQRVPSNIELKLSKV
jgi:hypothetical protein